MFPGNLPINRNLAKAFEKLKGDSERKIEEALKRADEISPAVLWVDEISKGLDERG